MVWPVIIAYRHYRHHCLLLLPVIIALPSLLTFAYRCLILERVFRQFQQCLLLFALTTDLPCRLPCVQCTCQLPLVACRLICYLLPAIHVRCLSVACSPTTAFAIHCLLSPFAACCLLFAPVADISLPVLAIRYPLSCYLPPSPAENVFFHFLLSFRVTSPESVRKYAVAAGGGMLIASGRLSALRSARFCKGIFCVKSARSSIHVQSKR